MTKGTIGKLAVAAATITSVTAFSALGATGASAASTATTTASAPGHATAPRAADGSGCVTDTFDIFFEYIYEPCVLDMQVLLNNLWHKGVAGPNQDIATDGFFGINTGNDVVKFNLKWTQVPGQYGEMTPRSWSYLCVLNWQNGFTGVYWHGAGCGTIPL